MTDNEIIKALECCNKDNEDCWDCPLQNKWDCHNALKKDALDLINRQKAEIKELQLAVTQLFDKAREKRDELELYKNIKTTINKFWDILLRFKIAKRKESPTLEEFAEAIQEIEFEAIKEFVERLIPEIVNRPSKIQSASEEYLYGSAYRQNEIIDLIKEMESENNV